MLMALAASRAAAAIAVRADYRDADGFVDCWPYCSTFQDVIGAKGRNMTQFDRIRPLAETRRPTSRCAGVLA